MIAPVPPVFALPAPAQEGGNGGNGGLSDVLTALAGLLTGADRLGPPGQAVREQVSWFDTFDWRLHRARLVLELRSPIRIRAARGGVLTLSSTAVPGTAASIRTATTTRTPSLAATLPTGPLGEALTPIVAPRALQVIATGTRQAVTVPVLDGRDKTVVRLRIEQLSLQDAGDPEGSGDSVSLPTRVCVVPLRGYEAAAARVSAALGDPIEFAMPAEALAVLGIRPGAYTGKLSIAIRPDQPAGSALAAILGHLVETVRINVEGTIVGLDSEFLHDLRVAVRRARSAVKLLTGVLPSAHEAHLVDQLRWLGEVTGPPRDLDVLELVLDEVAATWPAEAAGELAEFRRLLLRRKARAAGALRTALRSDRFVALLAALDTAAAGSAGVDAGPHAGTPINILAAKRLRRVATKVLSRGELITPESPGEPLHDLRKRCKELRYLLELLAPAFDPVPHGRVVRDLKALQEVLGDFQDGEVHRDAVREAARDLLASGLRGGADLDRLAPALLAMGRLAGELDGRQVAARNLFAERWTRFTQPATLGDLATLGGRAGPSKVLKSE
jgi:CHAD domain-containing protein